MKYLCTNCGYIYDESFWDKDENIKAWTKFFDLWNDYVCPICWEESQDFQEIIEEINYLDKDNLIWIDLEHFIDIKKLDAWKIEVLVGKWGLHPSWEEHKINHIYLLDEYWDLVDEKFLSTWEDPIVEFDVSDLDEYTIIARCTIHWLWGRKVEQ